MVFITLKVLFTFFDIAKPYGSKCNAPSSLLPEQAQKILHIRFYLLLNLFHYPTCFYQRVALCATM